MQLCLAACFFRLGYAGSERGVQGGPDLFTKDLFEDRGLLFDGDAISDDQLPVLLVDPASTLLKAVLPEGLAELRELKAQVGVPSERAHGPPSDEVLISVREV